MAVGGELLSNGGFWIMEMQEFIRQALKNVSRKIASGALDKHEKGYSDEEEMLLDWMWIELKEVSPDKDAVIDMELDDVYELIENSAELYDDYQMLLESLREKGE
jgi:hypothetical protein